MSAILFLIIGLDPSIDPAEHGGSALSLTDQQIDTIAGFVRQHAWLPLVAFAIHYAVRLLKTDTKLPWDIDPDKRAWVAVGLGFLAGVLDAVISQLAKSEPFTAYVLIKCVVQGLSAGGGAILIQNLVVDGHRKGRELPLVPESWLKPGVSPAPGKPPSIPPEEMTAREKTDTAKMVEEARERLTPEQEAMLDSFVINLGKDAPPKSADSTIPPVLDPAAATRETPANEPVRDLSDKKKDPS